MEEGDAWRAYPVEVWNEEAILDVQGKSSYNFSLIYSLSKSMTPEWESPSWNNLIYKTVTDNKLFEAVDLAAICYAVVDKLV